MQSAAQSWLGVGGGCQKKSATQGDRRSFLSHMACQDQILHQVTHQKDRDLFAGYSACGQDPRLDSTVLSGLFCCCLGKLNGSLQVGLRPGPVTMMLTGSPLRR